jgi:hypothetical protein
MPGSRPVPVTTRRVDPDPSIASAIGRHHSLQTAVADLVDNSLDAGAKHVLIRVLQREERAIGLLVIDDGSGMDTETIDNAMGYAHKREYGDTDLGHFGIGLKAASMSQANTLFVWSRRHGGPAVGRGLERSTLDVGPEVQTFAGRDAEDRLNSVRPGFALVHGTVVEWRDVRGFLQSPDPEEQSAWLERSLEDLRVHLGLVLHRILVRGDVAVTLDVLNEDYADLGGAVRTVEALDPFGYPASGAAGYPIAMTLILPGGQSDAVLHLWPTVPSHPSWTLSGRSPLDTQGLYVYRNDRLLQTGGWNGLTTASRDLACARVAVDIGHVIRPHLTINPEKTGVVVDTSFTEAWLAGYTSAGDTFADYLAVARSGAQTARKRHRRPVEVAEPGKGLPADVVDAIDDNATFLAGDPVHLRWKNLNENEVFRVDRDARTIWLNVRHKAALGGAAGLSNEDAAVTKMLLLLLLGGHASSAITGPKERRDEEAWQAMLLAAVHAQTRQITPIPDAAVHPGEIA